MKLKRLQPTLREKKRYVAYEIIGGNVDFSDVSKAITGAALSFIGTSGVAAIGLKLLSFEKKRGIAKVSHQGVNSLKASLALIQKIGDSPAVVRSVGVSGILKKAQTKYIAEV